MSHGESGEEHGSCPRDHVLEVLKNSGVHVAASPNPNGGASLLVTLEKGTVLEVHVLEDPVRKRMLGRLTAKFDVDKQLFWHPELLK